MGIHTSTSLRTATSGTGQGRSTNMGPNGPPRLQRIAMPTPIAVFTGDGLLHRHWHTGTGTGACISMGSYRNRQAVKTPG